MFYSELQREYKKLQAQFNALSAKFSHLNRKIVPRDKRHNWESLPEPYYRVLNTEIKKLGKLLDESNFRNGQYARFVETFRSRYPSQYADIVLEFNKEVKETT